MTGKQARILCSQGLPSVPQSRSQLLQERHRDPWVLGPALSSRDIQPVTRNVGSGRVEVGEQQLWRDHLVRGRRRKTCHDQCLRIGRLRLLGRSSDEAVEAGRPFVLLPLDLEDVSVCRTLRCDSETGVAVVLRRVRVVRAEDGRKICRRGEDEAQPVAVGQSQSLRLVGEGLLFVLGRQDGMLMGEAGAALDLGSQADSIS